METFARTALVLIAFSTMALALQQYSGELVIDAFNGTNASIEYTWLINDEANPINISVTTACMEGKPSCEFLNFIEVSPMDMVIQPNSEAKVTVVARLPGDAREGNYSGYLFAKKMVSNNGQVAIQLQVGKLVTIAAHEKKPPVLATEAPQAPAAAQQNFWTPQNTLLVFLLVLCAVIVIAYMAWKASRKKAEGGEGEEAEKPKKSKKKR